MVRCVREVLGLAYTIREVGHKAQVRVCTDAAAARDLALRSWSGAIKHIECTRPLDPSTVRGTLLGRVARQFVALIPIVTSHITFSGDMSFVPTLAQAFDSTSLYP